MRYLKTFKEHDDYMDRLATATISLSEALKSFMKSQVELARREVYNEVVDSGVSTDWAKKNILGES